VRARGIVPEVILRTGGASGTAGAGGSPIMNAMRVDTLFFWLWNPYTYEGRLRGVPTFRLDRIRVFRIGLF